MIVEWMLSAQLVDRCMGAAEGSDLLLAVNTFEFTEFSADSVWESL